MKWRWPCGGICRSHLLAALVSICLLLVCLAQEGAAQDRGRALGREMLRIDTGGGAYDLAWSPDQKSLIGVVNRSLVSWDLSSGSVRWKLPFVRLLGGGGQIAFLDGGARIVVHYTKAQPFDDKSNHAYALSIVDAQSGRIIRDVPFDPPPQTGANRASSFAVSEDGRTIVVALGILGQVVIADTGRWQEIWRSPRKEAVASIALDQGRDRLILAGRSGGGRVQTWRLSSKSKISEFTTYKAGLSRMVFDRQTGAIFTGGDGKLQPVQPPIPGRPETFAGVEDDPETLVRAWDPATGTLLRTYVGPGRTVSGLALSPNGKYLVAAKSRSIYPQKDAYVLAWETASGRLVVASSYGQGFLDAVAFSPNGERIAVSSDAGIRIFQLIPALFP